MKRNMAEEIAHEKIRKVFGIDVHGHYVIGEIIGVCDPNSSIFVYLHWSPFKTLNTNSFKSILNFYIRGVACIVATLNVKITLNVKFFTLRVDF